MKDFINNEDNKYIFNFYADTNKKNKESFNDALPIGNGSMGAMIYGHPFEEKLILNEDSLWLGAKNRIRYNKDFYKKYQIIQKHMLNNELDEAHNLAKFLFSSPKGECIYTVAGELKISFLNYNYSNYKRILDMDNGLVKVKYILDNNNHIERTYFASNPDNLIVINIKSEYPIGFSISLDREKLFDSIERENNDLILSYKYNNEDTLIIRMSVKTDGEMEIIGDNIKISNSQNTIIYLVLRTTYYNNDIYEWCRDKLTNLDYNTILEKHISDYKSLFKRQIFKTNNKKINYLYNFSRYLMISGSRINSQPLNLQGIWNQDIFPAWDSKYTININLEMNYWNVFKSNLVECSLPYFNLLKRIHKNGSILAKEMFNSEGFVAFHNSDIYGDVAPQDKYMPATLWPLGGAWLALLIYEYYEYTNDINFLKEYEYIINDACLFFKSILIENDKHELIITPSLSPENSYVKNSKVYNLSNGAQMDSQILRDLFTKAIIINSKLKIKNKENLEYHEILNKLPKIKIGTDGRIMEWNEELIELVKGHRHISHLYGLFPSNQITEDNQKLFNAAKLTLKTRLENGSGHTGWSKAWITAMLARLKMSNEAFESINEFIKNSTSSVGLDLHPPFQIDGNFGISRAISELLVKDENEEIEILPGLPDIGLEDGLINGFLLKGNITLNLEWKQNKVRSIELINNTSEAKIIKLIYQNNRYDFTLNDRKIINI